MSVSRHQIAHEIIQRVREANLLEELASADVKFRRAGASLVGLCLFHQEKTPSFTVIPARQRFHCFGCGAGGDVIAYEMARHGVGFTAALHKLALRVGIHLEGLDASSGMPIDPPRRQKPPAVEEPVRVLQIPPDLRPLTVAEVRSVAERRGLSTKGLDLAASRGLLWHGSPRGLTSWIVTDSARINAQARRMDGRLWQHIGSKKACTLKGSQGKWPLGAREAGSFPCVALVEGGPDLLAACHYIVAEAREGDVAPVAMLGAANPIPENALLFLANKRVRIFPHLDPAGREAALRWTRQLERVGCEVDAFDFRGLTRSDGEPVIDLNDLALIDADCFERKRAELSEVLPR